MEQCNTVVCFSKIDGFENPPQKIDGFGRTRRTPSDDSTVVFDRQIKVCIKLSFHSDGFGKLVEFEIHM